MNIKIIYFTGTYNTKFLAEKLRDIFSPETNNMEIIEIGKDTPIADLNDTDLLLVGYPIYGFNSQPVLTNYFRKVKKLMKPGKIVDYIIFKNSGETYAMNNSSSRVLKRVLDKKHFRLLSEYHFPMPYNIHFPFSNNLIKQIINYNNKQLEILKYNYDNDVPHLIKSKIIYDIGSWFVSIQKLGGFLNSFLYRVDARKCIKCNRCINICPMKNIYIDKHGRIKFHHDCMMCMRCSFYCPTDAFSIGFINSWKVSNYYNLKKIEEDNSIELNFITDDTKGFYKCYIKTFREIDEAYDKIKNQ